MSTHTPTPWAYRRETLGHPDNARNPIVRREAGGYIARLFSDESTLLGMTSLAPSAEQAEANAYYIVRAVNSHADLLDALQWAEAAMDDLNVSIGTKSHPCSFCRAEGYNAEVGIDHVENCPIRRARGAFEKVRNQHE